MLRSGRSLPHRLLSASRAALDEACSGRVPRAELHFLHVLSLRTADPSTRAPLPRGRGSLRPPAELASSEMATCSRTPEEPFRIARPSRPRRGRSRHLDYARSRTRLVVMGTHGRRGRRTCSSAASPPRSPPLGAPVLVVPSRGERPPGRIRRVLAPVDFSAASLRRRARPRPGGAVGATLELFTCCPTWKCRCREPRRARRLGTWSHLDRRRVGAGRARRRAGAEARMRRASGTATRGDDPQPRRRDRDRPHRARQPRPTASTAAVGSVTERCAPGGLSGARPAPHAARCCRDLRPRRRSSDRAAGSVEEDAK